MKKLEHFRHIPFEFNRGAKAAKAARNICAKNGDNPIRESTSRKWFSRFEEDRFDIVTLHVQEDLRGFHVDRLNTLIHNDPCQCTRALAAVVNCDNSTIVRHLHSVSKVQNRVYEYRVL